MAEANTDLPSGEEEIKPKKSKLGPLLVILVTAAGGYFAGTSFLAPRLLASGDAGADPVAEERAEDDGQAAPEDDGHGTPADDGHGAPASGAGDDGHGGASPPEDGHFMEIGNLLVNPRDSRGLRFLMASIALEVEDDDTRTMLRQREAQVRDVIISVLEHMTLDELATPGIRDSIRIDVRKAIVDEFHMSFLNVFISQYVIN